MVGAVALTPTQRSGMFHYIPSPPPGGQIGEGARVCRKSRKRKKSETTQAFEHSFVRNAGLPLLSAGGWRRQLPARESALGPTARGASAPSAQPQARPRSGAS